MGRRANISDFNDGQIVGARRLDASNLETAALVRCYRTTASRMDHELNDHKQIFSRRAHMCQPRVIHPRGERRMSRLEV